MREWIRPVYDRTASDLLQAEQQIKQWIKEIAEGKSVSMTNLKGCLNARDLNRLENNIKFLYEELLDLAYDIQVPTGKKWTVDTIPTQVDINNTLNRLWILVDRLLSTNTPTEFRTYDDVNTAEYLTQLMYDLVKLIPTRYTYVGTLISGTGVIINTMKIGVGK